jgi:hypothetical protein
VEDGILFLYDRKSGDLITTAGAPGGQSVAIAKFLNPDTVRVVSSNANAANWEEIERIFSTFDLPAKKGAKMIERHTSPWPPDYWFDFDPSLQYLVPGFWESSRDQYGQTQRTAVRNSRRVFDAETITYRFTINGALQGFLVDGRLWSTFEDETGSRWVSIQDPVTGNASEYDLQTSAENVSIKELASGGMVVALGPTKTDSGWKTYWSRIELMDPDTGNRRLIGENLSHRGYWGPSSEYSINPYGQVSGSSTRVALFTDRQGSIYAWDPDGQRMVRLHETDG